MEKAFEKSHPVVMALYFMISAVLVMYMNHPAFLIVSFVIATCNASLFVKAKALFNTLKGSFVLVACIVFINVLFNQNGETELITFFGKAIMLEVVVYSAVMGLMLANIFQLSLLFNETINGPKLLFLLSKLLPKTGLVTMLALRYVPLLLLHIKEIMSVQKLRGYSVTEGTLVHRTKSGLLIIQLLLSISLEDALQTADSIKARGYGLPNKRASYTTYHWSNHDTVSMAALVILFAAVIGCTFYDIGLVTIYPKLAIDWTMEHLAVSIVGCFMIGFPLILQSLEWCKWKYYSLKM